MNKQQLEFVIFCIETALEQNRRSPKETYKLVLKDIDMQTNIKEFQIQREKYIADELAKGNVNDGKAEKIIFQMLYTHIIIEFSKETRKTIEESLKYFYYSNAYELISKKISDMHCRSIGYLVDELMLEYGFKEHISFPKEWVHKLD